MFHDGNIVSIHALVRVRPPIIYSGNNRYGFNPRTRESATRGPDFFHRGKIVSIHALVRVRRHLRRLGRRSGVFQSTHS